VDRRLMILLALALVITQVAIAEGGKETAGAAKVIELNMAWWGAQARHDKFNAILDLYEKRNPNIKVIRQYAPWGDYWSKMATQMAGGTLPDTFGMTAQFKGDYASKGAMTPLKEYVDRGLIDIKDFSKGAIDAGSYGGVFYMVTFGDTASTLVYNTRILKDAGYPAPGNPMSYDEQKAYLLGLQPKLPKGVWAEFDDAKWEHGFENFVRQRGYELTTPDGKKIGYPKEVFREYLAFWGELSKAGAVPPPSVMAEQAGKQWADTMNVQGKVALWYTNANQVPIFQMYIKDELNIVRSPIANNPKRKFVEMIQPSAWTISKTSKYKDEVAKLISWFANDLDAQKIFAMELGSPGSSKVTKMLIDNMKPDTNLEDRARTRILAFMAEIGRTVDGHAGRTRNAPALMTDYAKKYDEYSFGRLTLDQAVDAHFNAAETMLQ
jgi:multiple sugar transport system substrate-binding protein